MNKLKNVLWVGIIILLLSACGQLETTPAPADMPEPMVTPGPVENIPTAVPANGSDPEKFNNYIGLSYPPFPADLSQGFSMIIQNSDGYGLSLVTDGTRKMLWLSKITQYDTNGSPYWEVKDVLELSNLEAGLTLIPDGCLLNGVPESEIFVAGRNGMIVMAWRANTALDVFEVIPTKGIKCSSDKGVDLG